MPAELLLQIRVTDILEKLTHMAMAALYSIVRAVFVDPAFVRWITPEVPGARRVATPLSGGNDLRQPFSA